MPDTAAASIGQLKPHTFFGTSEVVLVLGSTSGPGGHWSSVRYPGLGPRTGWVPARALGPATSVNTLLVVDRRRTRVRLFKAGRPVFRAPVGVGARQSPTPAGRYYVRERLVPAASDSIYGVLAFGLSAYSRFRTDWPGGGQVGLHGTNEPDLIPGHISNGCIRLRNRDVLRLDRLMAIGTPVRIISVSTPEAQRRAQHEPGDDQRRDRHDADLPREDGDHHAALLVGRQPPHRLGVLEVARVEHGLGGRDAQLLGDERHRQRQQRVDPVEAVVRFLSR